MSGGTLLPAKTPVPGDLQSWVRGIIGLQCKGTEAKLSQCTYRVDPTDSPDADPRPCASGNPMAIKCTGEWLDQSRAGCGQPLWGVAGPGSGSGSLCRHPFLASPACVQPPALRPCAWLMATQRTSAAWKSRCGLAWKRHAEAALEADAERMLAPANSPRLYAGARTCLCRRSTAAGGLQHLLFRGRGLGGLPAAQVCGRHVLRSVRARPPWRRLHIHAVERELQAGRRQPEPVQLQL